LEGRAFVAIAVGERTLAASGDASRAAEKCHVLRDTFSGKEICVFVEGWLAARVELAERWREGMEEALADLSTMGVSAEVLSGDPDAERGLAEIVHGPLGAEAAAEAGQRPALPGKARIVVRGGMTPQAKHARVGELVQAGRCVAFFGDGVNDAAAMSAAEVSVAMRGGTELARASAMAVFAGDDWRFIPHAIRIARATRRGIRANLWFASVYNIIGMALAAAGVLHPVAAALLMVGSSVLVSVRAMRSSGVD
jgi:cation transport ATPase